MKEIEEGCEKKEACVKASPKERVVEIRNRKRGLFPAANNHGGCYIYSPLTHLVFSATLSPPFSIFPLRLCISAAHHNGHQCIHWHISLHAICHSSNTGIVFPSSFHQIITTTMRFALPLDLFITSPHLFTPHDQALDAFITCFIFSF